MTLELYTGSAIETKATATGTATEVRKRGEATQFTVTNRLSHLVRAGQRLSSLTDGRSADQTEITWEMGGGM